MKKAGGPPPSDTQIRKVAETAPPSKSAIRSESETRKRVKINEVPEYAPAKLPAKTPAAAVVVTTHQVANLSNVKRANGHNTIIVIIPMGIPGMGKSTFVETQLRPYFEGTDINFTTFASDKIRKEVLEEHIAHNKKQGVNKSRD